MHTINLNKKLLLTNMCLFGIFTKQQIIIVDLLLEPRTLSVAVLFRRNCVTKYYNLNIAKF